jgi:hypothetical protein
MTPIANNMQGTDFTTPVQEQQTTVDEAVLARMHKLASETIAFIGEIKDIPNFMQELPTEKEEYLQKLTTEGHELLGLHPVLNLKNAKKIQEQLKANLAQMEMEEKQVRDDLFQDEGDGDPEMKEMVNLMKNIPLSELMFDCGGLLKMLEAQKNALIQTIADFDKIINFQEDPNKPLSKNSKYPLLELVLSLNRLLKSGFNA